LKPSKFRGVLSQGMLLAASSGDTVRLLSPPDNAVVGERVALEGIDWQGEADAVLKPKQKVFEQVVPFLKTNSQGIATYRGIALKTLAGPVTCEIKDAQIS
jgi:aminoacyl tRNA synthase complex-interacting multifunctional protein 1